MTYISNKIKKPGPEINEGVFYGDVVEYKEANAFFNWDFLYVGIKAEVESSFIVNVHFGSAIS